MPCTICGLSGHNIRTCLQNINKLDDIKINSKESTDKHSIEDCVICFNTIKYKVVTPCKHTFCSKCIFTNITHGNFNCPLCRNLLVNPKISLLKKYRKKIRKLKIELQHLQYKLNNKNINGTANDTEQANHTNVHTVIETLNNISPVNLVVSV